MEVGFGEVIFSYFPRMLGRQGGESQVGAFVDCDHLEIPVDLAEASWNQGREASDGQNRKE